MVGIPDPCVVPVWTAVRARAHRCKSLVWSLVAAILASRYTWPHGHGHGWTSSHAAWRIKHVVSSRTPAVALTLTSIPLSLYPRRSTHAGFLPHQIALRGSQWHALRFKFGPVARNARQSSGQVYRSSTLSQCCGWRLLSSRSSPPPRRSRPPPTLSTNLTKALKTA